MKYTGETHRGLHKRIQEHRMDLRRSNDSNALVVHRESTGHLPSFENASVRKICLSRVERKLAESVFIAAENGINIRESSHRISPALSRVLLDAL